MTGLCIKTRSAEEFGVAKERRRKGILYVAGRNYVAVAAIQWGNLEIEDTE